MMIRDDNCKIWESRQPLSITGWSGHECHSVSLKVWLEGIFISQCQFMYTDIKLFFASVLPRSPKTRNNKTTFLCLSSGTMHCLLSVCINSVHAWQCFSPGIKCQCLPVPMTSLWQSQQGMDRDINHTVAQALMLMLADIFPPFFFSPVLRIYSSLKATHKGIEMYGACI